VEKPDLNHEKLGIEPNDTEAPYWACIGCTLLPQFSQSTSIYRWSILNDDFPFASSCNSVHCLKKLKIYNNVENNDMTSRPLRVSSKCSNSAGPCGVLQCCSLNSRRLLLRPSTNALTWLDSTRLRCLSAAAFPFPLRAGRPAGRCCWFHAFAGINTSSFRRRTDGRRRRPGRVRSVTENTAKDDESPLNSSGLTKIFICCYQHVLVNKDIQKSSPFIDRTQQYNSSALVSKIVLNVCSEADNWYDVFIFNVVILYSVGFLYNKWMNEWMTEWRTARLNGSALTTAYTMRTSP